MHGTLLSEVFPNLSHTITVVVNNLPTSSILGWLSPIVALVIAVGGVVFQLIQTSRQNQRHDRETKEQNERHDREIKEQNEHRRREETQQLLREKQEKYFAIATEVMLSLLAMKEQIQLGGPLPDVHKIDSQLTALGMIENYYFPTFRTNPRSDANILNDLAQKTDVLFKRMRREDRSSTPIKTARDEWYRLVDQASAEAKQFIEILEQQPLYDLYTAFWNGVQGA
jgi:hypothetical protein